jgi:Region in Clathrin and VPS
MDYELKTPLVGHFPPVLTLSLIFCTESYIKAADPSNYVEVIELANRAGKQEDLVRYLQMARKTLREPKIDTELAYAYAKTDRLHDMEDFLGMTNVADILVVGEKCFEDELYQAAKLLFTSISNWARLATTLIYLGENQAAVESARKAGNTQYVTMLCKFSYWTNGAKGFGSKFMPLVSKRLNSDS